MTVAELIAELQKLPPDAQIVISDADTGWDLKAHASLGYAGPEYGEGDESVVYLWGSYYETEAKPAAS